MKTIDLTGHRYGRWTVLRRVKGPKWLCRCECGSERQVLISNLRSGGSTQCKSCSLSTHGRIRSGGDRTYGTWRAMRTRCQAKSGRMYQNYAARGIGCCERWNDFQAFLEDMGEAPDGMTLGRINNDQGYSPDNCRWESTMEQARNKRTNVMLTHKGRTMCLTDWAAEMGIVPNSLKKRLKLGWTMDECVAGKRSE